ncbi:unnamed protein product [Symbiodinium natans]|uniref:Uncharacterized protein n=1 Tax=Symbiodinium natans TaxID=878477 RepID=A0A812JY16_9DINO|nr:unnamed protein product [Symbiodinium natans]
MEVTLDGVVAQIRELIDRLLLEQEKAVLKSLPLEEPTRPSADSVKVPSYKSAPSSPVPMSPPSPPAPALPCLEILPFDLPPSASKWQSKESEPRARSEKPRATVSAQSGDGSAPIAKSSFGSANPSQDLKITKKGSLSMDGVDVRCKESSRSGEMPAREGSSARHRVTSEDGGDEDGRKRTRSRKLSINMSRPLQVEPQEAAVAERFLVHPGWDRWEESSSKFKLSPRPVCPVLVPKVQWSITARLVRAWAAIAVGLIFRDCFSIPLMSFGTDFAFWFVDVSAAMFWVLNILVSIFLAMYRKTIWHWFLAQTFLEVILAAWPILEALSVPHELDAAVEPLQGQNESEVSKGLSAEDEVPETDLVVQMAEQQKQQIAGALARMDECRPGIIQAAYVGEALSCLCRVVRGGTTTMAPRSFATKRIDEFWSHSWHGRTWSKVWTIIYMNNNTAGMLLATMASLVVCFLSWFSLVPHWSTLTGSVVYCSMLLFWRPRRRIFLDVLCIDQDNHEMKEAALISMGAFLKCSEAMVVLWDPSYTRRL